MNPCRSYRHGLDVIAAEGNMVVDIGGGTTEIAVIVQAESYAMNPIRIAGDGFTADIQAYMRHQHNIKVGKERPKI
jgi:rod shape-determining protein MreB